MSSFGGVLESLFGGSMAPMQAPGSGTFRARYHVYSPAYWDSENRDKLETGDKVVVPASALEQLSRLSVSFPIMFRIIHRFGDDGTAVWASHCSVLEFTADEGNVYMPLWMIDNLALDPNGRSVLELESVSLPKGSFVQFQAHETKFAMLRNPRIVLESALRNYSALTVGDTIQVAFPPDGPMKHVYKLDVTEVKPKMGGAFPDAICIIETDVTVDFKEPKDYKVWEAKQKALAEKKKRAFVDDSTAGELKDEDEEWLATAASKVTTSKSSHFDQLQKKGFYGHSIKATRRKSKKGTATASAGLSSAGHRLSGAAADSTEDFGPISAPAPVMERMSSVRGVPLGVKKPIYPMGRPTGVAASSQSPSKRKRRREEEIVGAMRYIYEVDDATGDRKCVRRLPVRKAFWEESAGHSLK